MKKFVVNTATFILGILLFFGANALFNFSLYTLAPVAIKKQRVLIIGDSHTQQSLNPNLFHDAQNISLAAEPYVLTYWKLKKITESYRPDTLIVGFGPHNFAKYHDFKFAAGADESWSTELFKRSYAIEHFNEIDTVISVDYLTYYKTLWKQICFYPRINHTNYLGYYYSANATWDLNKWEPIIKKQYLLENNEFGGLSHVSVRYLDSIVTLCQAKKITLVLAGSPVYKEYYDHIPTEIIHEFDSLKTKYRQSAIIIDRVHDFYPDSLYLDADHLNERGATRFTKEVMEELKPHR